MVQGQRRSKLQLGEVASNSPVKVFKMVPDSTSNNRTILSYPPVAIWFCEWRQVQLRSSANLVVPPQLTPIGCHLAAYTSPKLPSSVVAQRCSSSSACQFHTLTVLSPEALAILSPVVVASTSQIRLRWPRMMVVQLEVAVSHIRTVLSLK